MTASDASVGNNHATITIACDLAVSAGKYLGGQGDIVGTGMRREARFAMADLGPPYRKEIRRESKRERQEQMANEICMTAADRAMLCPNGLLENWKALVRYV